MDKDPVNKTSEPSPETEESIERGKKADEAAKKFDPKTPEQNEEDGKRDAEKWRNEG